MITYPHTLNVKEEAESLAYYLTAGNPCASLYLARLIELDNQGTLQPFADALAARLQDHLQRWAELGSIDLDVVLEDEVYQLLKVTAVDWDGVPYTGYPGEED